MFDVFTFFLDKSNEKALSAFYAFISPEVLKTAKKRHQCGQMIELVYQVGDRTFTARAVLLNTCSQASK